MPERTHPDPLEHREGPLEVCSFFALRECSRLAVAVRVVADLVPGIDDAFH
jgi:hypothetical protein